MSARWLLFLFSAAASAFVLSMACSSTTVTVPSQQADAAQEEEGFVVPSQDGGGACVLEAGTSRESCNDCLQASCCGVVNGCFADPRCANVNACMNDCSARFGRTDAGADCVRACASADQEGAKKLLDMLDCQTARCRAPCQG